MNFIYLVCLQTLTFTCQSHINKIRNQSQVIKRWNKIWLVVIPTKAKLFLHCFCHGKLGQQQTTKGKSILSTEKKFVVNKSFEKYSYIIKMTSILCSTTSIIVNKILRVFFFKTFLPCKLVTKCRMYLKKYSYVS